MTKQSSNQPDYQEIYDDQFGSMVDINPSMRNKSRNKPLIFNRPNDQTHDQTIAVQNQLQNFYYI
jgi:hypothetical protein